ncbi:hypothetical protein EVAR_90618_1 [Eumeta japonica]|uniref:Uncharacterized protein n=1 Tax=Eumeta variegata TaxID=151549 RepID=A0A4C1ZVC0_EUMVA|nr:hypothetical protein EVAR_90618_1 [Eumeta japonica]
MPGERWPCRDVRQWKRARQIFDVTDDTCGRRAYAQDRPFPQSGVSSAHPAEVMLVGERCQLSSSMIAADDITADEGNLQDHMARLVV